VYYSPEDYGEGTDVINVVYDFGLGNYESTFFERIDEAFQAIGRASEYRRWFTHKNIAEEREEDYYNAHEREAWEWGHYVGDPFVVGIVRISGETWQFFEYSIQNA